MPGSKGSAAVSEKIRDSIATHSFMGEDGKLRGSALELKLDVQQTAGTLKATGTIRNAKAGHYLPAGMSGRQIVVRLCAANAAGQECVQALFERRLVDQFGKGAPFFRASRVERDTRLPP
jgi:hypothetical protein